AGNCAAPGIRRGSRSACARATSGPSRPAFALARCGGPVAGTRAIAQAALEQLGQVDDVAGARRDFAGLEWLDPFGVAPFDLLVDELHDGGFEVVLVSPRIPRLGHVVDQRARHLQYRHLWAVRRLAGGRQPQFAGVADVPTPAQRLEHEQRTIRNERGEVFARLDHDARDADFARRRERVAQQRVDPLSTTVRLEVERAIEVDEGDFGRGREGLERDRLRRAGIGGANLFVVEHRVLAVGAPDTAYDVLRRDFPARALVDAFVPDPIHR